MLSRFTVVFYAKLFLSVGGEGGGDVWGSVSRGNACDQWFFNIINKDPDTAFQCGFGIDLC